MPSDSEPEKALCHFARNLKHLYIQSGRYKIFSCSSSGDPGAGTCVKLAIMYEMSIRCVEKHHDMEPDNNTQLLYGAVNKGLVASV